jgi:hypothetical protein
MQIIVSHAKLKAFNGNLLFSAKVLNSEQGNYFIESKIDLKNVNITDAFQQCNNFGQENIIDKNIKGIYNGSIDFAGVWDEKLNCKTDKIFAQIKVQILNGELINYKPLSALSKFISLNDLQNLKFATLNNTIEISKKTITIPKMQIENNAANITLSGSQNFDNFIDYIHAYIIAFQTLLNDYNSKYYIFARKFNEDTSYSLLNLLDELQINS